MSGIACTNCQASVPQEVFNLPGLTKCRFCGAELRVEAFPALFRGQAPATAGETLLVAEESSCFYHPRKKAVLPCDGCGRFLCALCDVEFDGEHLCPACLEAGKRKGKLQNLENHRVLYGEIALILAVLPMLFVWPTIVTAPIAIFVAIRYWNAPTSILPRRTKARFVIAIVLASLQLLGWTFFLYYTFSKY